jgi:hypothetical protein
VHRRGLAARRRVSASARRRSTCVRFSARHSACSASASVAAPRSSSRRPVRPSQLHASLRHRSRLTHVHRLQAHAATIAAPAPPSAPPRSAASLCSTQRRVLHSTHAPRSALRHCLAATTAPSPYLPPRLQLRALQQPQHADSFAAQLHRIWTPSRTRHPFTRPAHPVNHRLAPPASERSLPRNLPLCTRSPRKLPGARAPRDSPARGIPALPRLPTTTAALRPASLRRSHENLVQRRGRAPAAPRRPSAPPLPSRQSSAHRLSASRPPRSMLGAS